MYNDTNGSWGLLGLEMLTLKYFFLNHLQQRVLTQTNQIMAGNSLFII